MNVSILNVEIQLIAQIKDKQGVFSQSEILQFVTGFVTALRMLSIYPDTDITNMLIRAYDKTGLI